MVNYRCEKLKFNTKQDLNYIKNYVIKYNPELSKKIYKIKKNKKYASLKWKKN